jgi:hypothetical protein
MRMFIALVFLLLHVADPANANQLLDIERASFTSFSTFSPPPTNPTFTALHTFFVSPTGSDSNPGTSAGAAWATPNHPVNCGDVIIAAAGTYSTGQLSGQFGAVSNCPSTSGGIDGTGGVFFAVLLCGGTDLGTTNGCSVTTTGAGDPTSLIEFNQAGSLSSASANNWAVEGFNLNSTPSAVGFTTRICVTGQFTHHIAIINDIMTNSLQGFGTNDCGNSPGSNTIGLDYVAVVGNIAQNANQDTICLAALDFISLGKFDSNAGTHAYMYNNYAMANLVPACTPDFDGEAYMMDSPEAHLYDGTTVFANNIGYDSTRYCIKTTVNGSSTPPIGVKIYNNTCFANDQQPGGVDNNGAEILTSAGPEYAITVWDNIALPPAAEENSVPLYAYNISDNVPASFAEGSAVGSGLQNVYGGFETTCANAPNCAPASPPFAEIYWDGNPVTGDTANTFTNTPGFTNTTDLLTNHVGVPNCTGFINATACMGWNANTSTMTGLTVISDLSTSSFPTKGFQPPSPTCVTGSSTGFGGSVFTDYPTWLKGIVYLHWNGASITENSDLVTKPCNM